MKKKVMKAGVLIVVFFAAILISSLVINWDVPDDAADMGAPRHCREFLFM